MVYHRVRCLNTFGKEVVLNVLCWETELPESRIPNSFKFLSSMSEVEAMEEKTHIIKALRIAGYDSLPTKENLIQCYLDYADAFSGDIDDLMEDIKDGSITVKGMCNSLIRCN